LGGGVALNCVVPVVIENRCSPFDEIFWTLTLRLFGNPHLKILRAIVGLNAILVVHVLKVLELASQLLLHHMQMLKLDSTVFRPSDVPALSVSPPTIDRFRSLPSSEFYGAGDRTATDSAISLGSEFGPANDAWFLNQQIVRLGRVAARLRAVVHAINLRCLDLKLLSAVPAVLRNWRPADDSSVSSVDSTWHVILHSYLKLDDSLYQNYMDSQITVRG